MTRHKESKKTRFLPLLLCVCLLTAGCQSRTQETAAESVPMRDDPYEAPVGDREGQYEMLATLYLPSSDGTQLSPVTEALTFSSSVTEAETVLRALLQHPAGEDYETVPGFGKVTPAATDAVTVSCGIATVNLSVAALSLSNTELFTLCQAIANTLCSLDDITGVNVLAAGVSPGLDAGGTLPLGCLSKNTLDDPIMLHGRLVSQRQGGLSGETPFRIDAALYFPALAGQGILCETQTIKLPSADPSVMTKALLQALSDGAAELSNVPELPDLCVLLRQEPVISDSQSTGQKTVVLSFAEELNEALANSGVTRSVMMASLTMTLCTFLPSVSSVQVSIGEERVTALVPAGLYENAGQTIGFSEGLMRRTDFSGFLLTNVSLYFPDADGTLCETIRSLPCAWARSPRRLYQQLLSGPQYYDTANGLKAVLPETLSDADLLGAYQAGDTLLLNFSERFRSAFEGLSAEKEKNAVYALVNTMTGSSSVCRVRFYFVGEQTDTLSGTLAMRGEFFGNAD